LATRRSVCIRQMNRMNSRSDHGHEDNTIDIVVELLFYLLITYYALIMIGFVVVLCKYSCTFRPASCGPVASFSVTSCKPSLSTLQSGSACLVSVTTSIIGAMCCPVQYLALSWHALRLAICLQFLINEQSSVRCRVNNFIRCLMNWSVCLVLLLTVIQYNTCAYNAHIVNC